MQSRGTLYYIGTMDNGNAVKALIDSNPRACYRTLERKLHKAGLLDVAAYDALAAARPNCGYGCDGDDDGPGCPVSGRCES